MSGMREITAGRGLGLAPKPKVTTPWIVPIVDGVNVTLNVHFVPAPRLAPHGLVPDGVTAYWPLAATEIFRAVLWRFEVTV